METNRIVGIHAPLTFLKNHPEETEKLYSYCLHVSSLRVFFYFLGLSPLSVCLHWQFLGTNSKSFYQKKSRSTITKFLYSTGKTAQMQSLRKVISNARRSPFSHVRSQRIVALQMSNLLARLQQTDQPQEPSLSPHR